MCFGKCPDFRLLTSSSNKAKKKLFLIFHLPCSIKQRIQRVAGAMIAGVHDDKFIVDAMTCPKRFSPLNVEPDSIVVRPWWYYDQLSRIRTLCENAIHHKPIKHNDLFGALQAIVEQVLK